MVVHIFEFQQSSSKVYVISHVTIQLLKSEFTKPEDQESVSLREDSPLKFFKQQGLYNIYFEGQCHCFIPFHNTAAG